ncbi:hypothetical protein [Modestobacter sp. KNN46-3]|jgi:hypothetical protein|uniref:hypothetical protein n=1 Tax=Modestobacter sp. KNN46-3 TaxID=2711218 RepID=UPI0013E015FB|nr:hypothetical protein [Modestobacter sp. KNN46-3]
MTTLASPRSETLIWALRSLGALLLAAMAAVHAHLWQQGYNGIPVIGPAFLVNAALGLLGALALVVAPRRWVPWVAATGAALAVGSLGALIVSTTVGLFGFVESTSALLWWESFWIEAAAVVVLVSLTSLAFHRRR